MATTMDVIETLQTLQSSGFRITKTRTAVLEIFSKGESPLAIRDLISKLKKRKILVNKTTVYREVEFLLTQNLIAEIDLFDGKKRYEVAQETGHHHHLVCTKCDSVQCVEMPNDLDLLEKMLAKKHRFLVTKHVLEFFGLCKDCIPA